MLNSYKNCKAKKMCVSSKKPPLEPDWQPQLGVNKIFIISALISRVSWTL